MSAFRHNILRNAFDWCSTKLNFSFVFFSLVLTGKQSHISWTFPYVHTCRSISGYWDEFELSTDATRTTLKLNSSQNAYFWKFIYLPIWDQSFETCNYHHYWFEELFSLDWVCLNFQASVIGLHGHCILTVITYSKAYNILYYFFNFQFKDKYLEQLSKYFEIHGTVTGTVKVTHLSYLD